MKAIKQMEVRERPREKLETGGVESLLDEELLALLLGNGTRRIGVHLLGREVLRVVEERNDLLSLSDLLNIKGMGKAKASKVLAAIEFARRRIRPRGIKIRGPQEILPLLHHWSRRQQEHFVTITLNGAHEVIETRVVTVGLANASQVHPREVFADAISDRACAIIAAHNHPSGNLTPSDADKKVTRTIKEAGALLGIPLLDHIIFSNNGYYSFQENGEL